MEYLTINRNAFKSFFKIIRAESFSIDLNKWNIHSYVNIHVVSIIGKDDKAAIRTNRGPGLSSMFAERWRQILASNNFGTANIDFC